MSYGCSSTAWSAVTSAAANAILAGVLAGFMINAIVMLLTKAKRAWYIQAASVLFAAFVALGLDSYLFALVAGERSSVPGMFSNCRRAWTEAMFAAGLLAVGTVAVIAGFTFVFAAYFQEPAAENSPDAVLNESMDNLKRLCNLLLPGVAVTVLLLLYSTARSYLEAIFLNHVPGWALLCLYGCILVGSLILLPFVVAGLFWHSIDNPVWNFFRPDDEPSLRKSVQFTIYCSVTYSLISVIAVTIISNTPADFWSTEHPETKAVIAGTIGWILLVSLIPVFLFLLRAVPSTFWANRRAGSP